MITRTRAQERFVDGILLVAASSLAAASFEPEYVARIRGSPADGEWLLASLVQMKLVDSCLEVPEHVLGRFERGGFALERASLRGQLAVEAPRKLAVAMGLQNLSRKQDD